MPIELVGGPGSQRSLGQGHFHQQQRSLRMGVARAHILRSLAFQRPGQRRPIEGLELQQTTFDIPKIIGRLAPRKSENSPNQSQAANRKRQARPTINPTSL